MQSLEQAVSWAIEGKSVIVISRDHNSVPRVRNYLLDRLAEILPSDQIAGSYHGALIAVGSSGIIAITRISSYPQIILDKTPFGIVFCEESLDGIDEKEKQAHYISCKLSCNKIFFSGIVKEGEGRPFGKPFTIIEKIKRFFTRKGRG